MGTELARCQGTMRLEKLVSHVIHAGLGRNVAQYPMEKNELSIRSATTNNGRHVVGPKEWHETFAFKASDQLLYEYYVASHGYTNAKEDFVRKEATHASEKADSSHRDGPQSNKVVWPVEELLEEYKDSPIGYSHLPVQG